MGLEDINSVGSQMEKSYDKRYKSGVEKPRPDNKGMDWYNYPLTGKAPV